jgi:hypothetical protein
MHDTINKIITENLPNLKEDSLIQV